MEPAYTPKTNECQIVDGPNLDIFVRNLQKDTSGHTNNWRHKANCLGVDTNLFFPEHHPTISDEEEDSAVSNLTTSNEIAIQESLRLCNGCEVRKECEDARFNGFGADLSHADVHGIWGGKTEHELRNTKHALHSTQSQETPSLETYPQDTQPQSAQSLERHYETEPEFYEPELYLLPGEARINIMKRSMLRSSTGSSAGERKHLRLVQ